MQGFSTKKIVLVKRGNCTFNEKVINVNFLDNIAGVIVYNDRQDRELRTIYVNNSSVPIVFINMKNGEKFSKLLQNNVEVEVSIIKDSYCEHTNAGLTKCIKYVRNVIEDELNEDIISHWDIVCISVALFLLTSFSLVCFLFYYLRKLRRVHKLDQMEQELEMKARKAVARLELRRVTESDVNVAGDCSVCLDPVVVGAELRSLPCGHSYHRKCIDKWLIRKRKCPLCKLDILHHFKYSLGDTESESWKVFFISYTCAMLTSFIILRKFLEPAISGITKDHHEKYQRSDSNYAYLWIENVKNYIACYIAIQ